MTFTRSLCALSALLLLAQARRLPGYRHDSFDLQVRQVEPTDVAATQAGVLTIITPSPGAVPVPVTEQSQIVTTYIPQFTLCDLPPVGFFPVPRPTTISSDAPFRNISMTIPPGNGTCETIYKTTATMVCATTLSDLTTTYTISKCPQDVTFSTQYGYVLATPTATANVTSNSTYGAMITPAPSMFTAGSSVAGGRRAGVVSSIAFRFFLTMPPRSLTEPFPLPAVAPIVGIVSLVTLAVPTISTAQSPSAYPFQRAVRHGSGFGFRAMTVTE